MAFINGQYQTFAQVANNYTPPVTTVQKAINNLYTPPSQIAGVQNTRKIPSAVNPTSSVNIPVNVPSGPDLNKVDQQANDYNEIIQQEYNNQVNQLAGEESGLRGQAQTAQSDINTSHQNVLTQLGQEQNTNQDSVNTSLQSAEKESKTGLQTARDLFRQIQQRNIAQLSSLGLSSSSVSEGMAEALGIDTARRISGITGSLSEVRNNAVAEMGRIKNYYESRKTTLEQEKSTRLQEINNSLMAGLRQIQSSRDQASTAKAKSRMDLFYNAQSIKGQLQQQYDAFKQSLDSWAAKAAEKVIPLTTDQFNQSFRDQMSNLQQTFDPRQYDLNPSVSMDRYGRMSGNITTKPKKVAVDPTNPSYWGG